MRIASINTTHNGSTGRIMRQITARANELGHMATSFSTQGISVSLRHHFISKPQKKKELQNHIYYGSYTLNAAHTILGVLTGCNGCFSVISTFRLLKKIKNFKPDLIHLHNLHGYNINLPLLFRYIKKNHIPVVWTFHDCWPFTGRCPYFTMTGCEKWKNGCGNCPYPKHSYPASYRDNTKKMWLRKNKWFTGVENLTIVTPSKWLADQVKLSFLSVYPVQVIHNGVDLSVFCPTESFFREKHHIAPETKLVLGVALGWGKRKGLDYMIELSKQLGPEYKVVLVGTDERTDQETPAEILSIHRTESQKQLAELYSSADVFVNPTREDNFPTVNLEALACGTPVVTFDVGGSPEMLDPVCGRVVAPGDMRGLLEAVKALCEEKKEISAACVKRAQMFSCEELFTEYVRLYERTAES